MFDIFLNEFGYTDLLENVIIYMNLLFIFLLESLP